MSDTTETSAASNPCEPPFIGYEWSVLTGREQDAVRAWFESTGMAADLRQRMEAALPYLTAIQNKPSAGGDAARWAALAEGLLRTSASTPSSTDKEANRG